MSQNCSTCFLFWETSGKFLWMLNFSTVPPSEPPQPINIWSSPLSFQSLQPCFNFCCSVPPCIILFSLVGNRCQYLIFLVCNHNHCPLNCAISSTSDSHVLKIDQTLPATDAFKTYVHAFGIWRNTVSQSLKKKTCARNIRQMEVLL